MIDILKTLCKEDGISGREHSVRERIISMLPKDCSFSVDALGNLLVKKRGEKRASQKVLFTAHMDEVGAMVSFIEEDGSIRFSSVGGVDPRVWVGRQVKVNGQTAVVGCKPIHMQKAEERGKAFAEKELYLDIGTDSREQTEKLVSLGDSVTFGGDFVSFGDHKIKSKAIDDRFGCAVLLKLLDQPSQYDFCGAFLTQEEVGTRGAKTAAFSIRPDIAVVLEATTAGDIPGVEESQQACCLEHGPVIPFMDRLTIYDHELYRIAFETAKKEGIPCQTKTKIAGGNDAGSISQAGKGVRTISLSLPCRYIHSPSSVADEKDMQYLLELAEKLLPVFCSM